MIHPNEAIAKQWILFFNAQNVSKLVELYDDQCTHTSPKIRALHPETKGQLIGKKSLAAWWNDSFVRFPHICYELSSVTATDERVVIEYVRHVPSSDPMLVAEFFDIRSGKIAASRVYHG